MSERPSFMLKYGTEKDIHDVIHDPSLTGIGQRWARSEAVKNPACPHEVLRHVILSAGDHGYEATQTALKHPNFRHEDWLMLAKSELGHVRRMALDSHHATKEHLEKSLKDPDVWVRKYAEARLINLKNNG